MKTKDMITWLQGFPEDAQVGIVAAWPDRKIILQHHGLGIFDEEKKDFPLLAVEVWGQLPFKMPIPEDPENKTMICAWLTATLALTRQCSDLTLLTYKKDETTGEETVTAHFANGQKKINVTADSGVAMIKDILRALS